MEASDGSGDPRTAQAAALMLAFAARTGLADGRAPRRYLWTDAFAVCNFLALARATGQRPYRDLALRLVEQVHHTLGRHRADDARRGWISGLSAAEGASHPTRGGLRIGKPLPERAPGEPFDAGLEWERDGQYFHYLTKWMHALDQVSRATRDPRFTTWARELDARACAAFVATPGAGAPRMCWKMSIDLARVLVPSMGQHDPLDGLVTTLQLRATAAACGAGTEAPDLAGEARRYAAIAARGDWQTDDPLGIGGLLCDAFRLAQLERAGATVDAALSPRVLDAARAGLDDYAAAAPLQAPPERRLAFRELGLAIGLHALALMAQRCPDGDAGRRETVAALARHAALAARIESDWLDPAHREAASWQAHRDINEVMLATCLIPGGFVLLAPLQPTRRPTGARIVRS